MELWWTALEHSESSSSKFFNDRSYSTQVMRWKTIETWMHILEDEFLTFLLFQRFFVVILFTTLAKDSKHAWSLFGVC